MAKKQTSQKEYWNTGAKQFPWPIVHEDKQIMVPEDELQYAEDDLMVQHFRANGWHIQSCISVQHTKVFVKPVTHGPVFRDDIKPVAEAKQEQFHCDDKFLIKSTNTRVMICAIDKKSIHLKYLDIEKDNIITTPENLARSLRMGTFEIIL